MLERAARRIGRHLHRCGLLGTRGDDLDLSGESDPESNLATSAVSGQSPPAGPQWSSGLPPLRLRALSFDKPLCASLDGFTLHAATRAGALDAEGREALLRYVLRGPRPGCALLRLRKSEWSSVPTASWPEARLRATDHAEEGVRRRNGRGRDGSALAPVPTGYERAPTTLSHHPLRGGPRGCKSMALAYQPAASPRGTPPLPPDAVNVEPEQQVRKSGYRPWAELLKRTFGLDVAQGQASRPSFAPLARGG